MKLIQVARAATAAFALALAVGAHAQASDTSANNAVAAAPTSAKATKAANRALAKKVHRALAHTKGLDPTHIYVKVVSGVVTLTGSCDSQNQMDLAVEAAKKVDGVTSVSNGLSIKTPD
ncbi:BON domain-containing protein [Paraburkholderia acidipaludis]|uniref:BON domain-containing protein n=1 Tax=Paraburkholderia acidipaludis TaxID=660537 RepID=UPI000481703E|nr:BON domain-containing protein [Paraburkholderia acidipaludis]